MNLNIIPSKGRFGGIVDKVNGNFDLIRIKIGEIEYLTSKNKGLFADAASLEEAIPNPKAGDWALVGTEFPAAIYVCLTEGTWEDSEQTYSGDDIQLNGYLLKTDFNVAKADIYDQLNDIQFALTRMTKSIETEEDGIFFSDESGGAFMKFDNTEGFDVSSLSEHFKSLIGSETVIKDVEEDGLYFTDGAGNAFAQFTNEEGFDLSAISQHLKSLIGGGGDAVIRDVEEDGLYFTDGLGNVFAQFTNEEGFDISAASQHFKNIMGGGSSPSTGSSIQNIDEDVVSLITNGVGESAMLWSDTYGLDVNKIAYNTLERIKKGYVKDMQEWQSLGTGMFIHWGVYSALKGHYTGTDIDGNYVDSDVSYNAEWVYRFKKIPDNTYKAYQSQFTASNWNADLVARMAYDCGMRYIIITAKHHEGFTLYDSQYANWDISTSGAAGKDPMMELKNACDRYGIKFCLYFSQVRDWYATGGFNQEWKRSNNQDPYTQEQHLAYIAMTVNILKEMIARYDPYVLWYDGPDASDEYANIILKAQLADYPQVITNWRLKSNYSVGDFATGEDDYFHGDREAWPYAENCYTLNGSWGYWETRDNAQYMCSLAKLIEGFILESKARTQNALINIGPKADGSIPQLIQNLFADYAEYTQAYGSFEGTEGVNIYSFPNWGRVLKKGDTLRLYVMDGSTSVRLDGVLTSRIRGIKVYGSNNGAYTINSDFSVTVTGIPVNSDYTPALVELYTDSKIVSEEYSNIIDSSHLYLTALAFNASGAKLQGFDDRTFQFGSWTSSSYWIETIFKFMGNTGQYSVTGTFPIGDNSLSVVVTLTSGNATQSVSMSRGNTTSASRVTLTNGRIYKVRLSHNGSAWVNFSRITFSN